MSEVDKSEQNQHSELKNNKECCNCSCSCKVERKEYVKRAQRNYMLRKLESDPNYVDKLREQKKKYSENNKDKVRESMRLYMQKNRAKKKAEKLAASSPIDTAMENLTIKDATLETPLMNPAIST